MAGIQLSCVDKKYLRADKVSYRWSAGPFVEAHFLVIIIALSFTKG